MRIGIMQGRLSPPVDGQLQAFPGAGWMREFDRAADAGLDCIEWIYAAPRAEANPIATDRGLREIATAVRNTGVAVRSVCADYFMEHRLVGVDAGAARHAFEHLQWLIGRMAAAGMERLVLPLVDASRLSTDADRIAFIETVERLLPTLRASRVELHLEVDLDPSGVAGILAALRDPAIWINYDSGNSASLGFDPDEEFAAYGRRIGSVHIKDRVRAGGSVPLGSGAADLARVCRLLREVAYEGDFILQTARGTVGDETDLARRNRERVERWFQCS